MKHVHIYKVEKKAEINIKTDNGIHAKAEALEMAKNKKLKFHAIGADGEKTEFIAIVFQGEFPANHKK